MERFSITGTSRSTRGRHSATLPIRIVCLGIVLQILIGIPSMAAGSDSTDALSKQLRTSFAGLTRQEMLLTNPAYLSTMLPACVPAILGGTIATFAEGCAYDPFRSRERWNGIRGHTVPIEFKNRNNVTLRGDLWGPLLPFRDPDTGELSSGPFPTVIVLNGSVGGSHGFAWAAEGLAESGYVVLTFDAEGQFIGNSDGSPGPRDPILLGTAYGKQIVLDDPSGMRPAYRSEEKLFMEGTEDALAWLRSAGNPWKEKSKNLLRMETDTSRIGLVGTSMGAWNAVIIGNVQPDGVKGVVAWDLAAELPEDFSPTIPTMFQQSDSGSPATRVPTINFSDASEPLSPNPDVRSRSRFARFKGSCVASMVVVPRGSTHFDWYFAEPWLQTSAYGERVGMYYTLAWLDRFVKSGVDRRSAETRHLAERRLLADRFDGSADRSSIGAGAWNMQTRSNEPLRIEGEPVTSYLSEIYRSESYLPPGDCATAK